MGRLKEEGLLLDPDQGGFSEQTTALADNKECHRSAIRPAMTGDETKLVYVVWHMKEPGGVDGLVRQQ